MRDRDILDLEAPAAFQVNTIDVDIAMLAVKWPNSPFFNVLIRLLVQVTDRSGRYPASPQSLRDILDPTYRYTGQIHLDQGFLDHRS